MPSKKEVEVEYHARGEYRQVAPKRELLYKDRLKANRAADHTLLFAPKSVRRVKIKPTKLR